MSIYWISAYQGKVCTEMFSFNGTKKALVDFLKSDKESRPFITEYCVTRERLDRTKRETYFPDYVKCPVI